MEQVRRRRVASAIGGSNVDFSDRGELTVDDYDFNDPMERLKAAELEQSDSQEDLRQKVNKERNAEVPVNKEAKSRFDILLGIARGTKDVVVDNITFSLRTLKSYESIDALSAAIAAKNAFEEMGSVRSRTLAYAIYKIDGVDSDRVFQTTSIDAKAEIIDNMSDAVVNYLFNEYNSLKNNIVESFSKDLEVNGEQTIKKS